LEKVLSRCGHEHINRQANPALEPNTDLAMGLLAGLDPEGRHDLVAIDPDLPKGHPDKIEAATFLANERDNMRAWIDARQGRRNLYTSVNRAREDAPRGRRLNANQIGHLRAVVGDIDASKIKGGDPSGINFQKERIRLQGVAESLAGDACPPSLLVDTGGGLQPWWQLRPIVEATPENNALVEGIGRTIQERHEGDGVWDIARIMRLPGTINVLSPEKRAQGRSQTVASVIVEKSKSTCYGLEQLKAWAPPTPERKSNTGTKAYPRIDMEVVAEATIFEELPAPLREKFETYLNKRPVVGRLWDGTPTPSQTDTSPSGFEYALCGCLKPSGLFTPTEFAQLVAIWPQRSEQHADDFERRIKRTWANHPAPYGGEGFDPVEINAKPAGKDKWEKPDDLWRGKSESADLPEGVVPEIVERYARDHARGLGVEPGAVAAALITALGAAVPAANTLQMRQSNDRWPVRPITWTAIIAGSGSNKSATIGCAVAPLKAIDARWHKDYAAAKRVHDGKLLAAGKKSAPSYKESADALWPEFESPPVGRQKIINNATTEATAELLSRNPDGLLFYADELAGFFGGMDLYRATKGGADRPFWLQTKDGDFYTQNRKTSGRIVVECCAVSVLGGIQPDKLKPLVTDLTVDGLFQRFLPIFLKRIDDGVDEPPDTDLDEAVARLAVDLSNAGVASFRFEAAADPELQAVLTFKNREQNRPDCPSRLKEWLGKMPNEFGRLALIFHFLEWHTSPFYALAGGPPPQLIPLATARLARRYLTDFVLSHAWAFYGRMLSQSTIDEHASWIAAYILTRGLAMVAGRDIRQAYSALKSGDKQGHLIAAMKLLEHHEWVMPAKRKGDTVTWWEVNPAVHDGRFESVTAMERARRRAAREGIVASADARRGEAKGGDCANGHRQSPTTPSGSV
jgi:hypothetical protein